MHSRLHSPAMADPHVLITNLTKNLFFPYIKQPFTRLFPLSFQISYPLKPRIGRHKILSKSGVSAESPLLDIDIVSTSAHKDGSIIFRFGNADEMDESVSTLHHLNNDPERETLEDSVTTAYANGAILRVDGSVSDDGEEFFEDKVLGTDRVIELIGADVHGGDNQALETTNDSAFGFDVGLNEEYTVEQRIDDDSGCVPDLRNVQFEESVDLKTQDDAFTPNLVEGSIDDNISAGDENSECDEENGVSPIANDLKNKDEVIKPNLNPGLDLGSVVENIVSNDESSEFDEENGVSPIPNDLKDKDEVIKPNLHPGLDLDSIVENIDTNDESSECDEKNGVSTITNDLKNKDEALKQNLVPCLDLGAIVDNTDSNDESFEWDEKTGVSTILNESTMSSIVDGKMLCASDEVSVEQVEAVISNELDSSTHTTNAAAVKYEIDEDSDVRYLLELMPASTPLEVELILDEETSSVEEEQCSDSFRIESSATVDNSASTLTQELNVNITEESNAEGVAMAELLEVESTRAASPRDERLLLSSSAVTLPHPSKASTGGEDAYFIKGECWFGVADGAGQWTLEGINAGLFAHELMQNCEKILSEREEDYIINAKELMNRSAAISQAPGSSTVLVGHFDDQVFSCINIGDSGFVIIRDGAVFKRSSPMLHEFNFPLQILRGDDPSRYSEMYEVELDEGDVIVTATNGLFDNLYEREVASIVARAQQTNLRAKEIAEELAKRAQDVGRSAFARSPFADGAQAAGYTGYIGGKLDDVTVIVSLVEKR